MLRLEAQLCIGNAYFWIRALFRHVSCHPRSPFVAFQIEQTIESIVNIFSHFTEWIRCAPWVFGCFLFTRTSYTHLCYQHENRHEDRIWKRKNITSEKLQFNASIACESVYQKPKRKFLSMLDWNKIKEANARANKTRWHR